MVHGTNNFDTTDRISCETKADMSVTVVSKFKPCCCDHQQGQLESLKASVTLK
jgi:hypothetical protein